MANCGTTQASGVDEAGCYSMVDSCETVQAGATCGRCDSKAVSNCRGEVRARVTQRDDGSQGKFPTETQRESSVRREVCVRNGGCKLQK